VQKTIYNYLAKYSDDADLVDRLIVSAFLHINKLPTSCNTLLNHYSIQPASEHFSILGGFLDEIAKSTPELHFEHLIELFEFVVSPSDKVVNGAVYTPKYIRTYIVERALKPEEANQPDYKVADIACGCGGFLLDAAERLKLLTGLPYETIYAQHLYGVDIMPYSISRTRLLLTLFAFFHGEDRETFTFNLFTGNSLDFNWREALTSPEFPGFHCVIGNPPYVASRNMDEASMALLANWRVAASGHPDLYIPFFQIGYELLRPQGILGFITVNTFIKSINGRALRLYFEAEQVDLEIINFGGEQVFKDRNAYTCICFLQRAEQAGIRYIRCDSQAIQTLNPEQFARFDYAGLHHSDGWNLVNSQVTARTLAQIEAIGLPFRQLYDTKNGIATLKNNVYKFKPYGEDAVFYYLTADPDGDKIEKSICRNIVNANKLKNETDIQKMTEQVIFPYTIIADVVTLIDERTMQRDFACTYRYLQKHKVLLSKRDKSKKTYEAWYAYGRRQSMDIKGFKLFFPHICERPRFVISQDTDLLFYNGIAVVSDDLQQLQILKRLMESELFYFYIKHTTKDYASGYISLSRNYLKNFGVYQFSPEEATEFLETEDPDQYLQRKYHINLV
jgi:adenine-specific DNA-methyltransferase